MPFAYPIPEARSHQHPRQERADLIRTNLATDLFRSALRELLEGGKMVVSPTEDHAELTGAFKFVGWQEYLLEAPGVRRKARNAPHD